MKRFPFGPLLACAAAAIALAFCGHEFSRLRICRSALASAAEANLTLQKQIGIARGRLKVALGVGARIQADIRHLQNSATGGSEAEIAAADLKSTSTSRNPVLRALFLKRFAEDFNAQWGPFFAQLKMSPDKIERFKAMQLENEQKILDVEAAIENQGVAHNDPVYAQMRSSIGGELALQMRALFGAGTPDYSAYNSYHHDQVLAPVVSQMATALYESDSPLTLDQSNQMMKLLAGASQRRQNTFVIASTVNWDAALSGAQATLPPSAVALLQTYAAQSQTNQQVSQLLGSSSPP